MWLPWIVDCKQHHEGRISVEVRAEQTRGMASSHSIGSVPHQYRCNCGTLLESKWLVTSGENQAMANMEAICPIPEIISSGTLLGGVRMVLRLPELDRGNHGFHIRLYPETG